MIEIFSESWMQALQQQWNAEAKITEPLAKAGFNARIAYGFKGEDKPRGMMVIENGKVVQAGKYDEGSLDWDLRAEPQKWQDWIETGFGLTRLGPAVATGALEFVSGNYRQMIRNPSLSHPFLQHFELMSVISK